MSKKKAAIDIEFLPIDASRHLAQHLAFREDAWLISFGSLQGYDQSETANWLAETNKNKVEFYHLWHRGQIIGQLEYQTGIATADGGMAGYVYLFYLRERWRGQGLGQVMHDFTMDKLREEKCQGVMLKYVPGNTRAEHFYLKNAWYKVKIVGEKNLQLMRKNLIGSSVSIRDENGA